MADRVDRDANRALRARFDDVLGQYQRLRSGLDDLQRQLAELRISATSRDGMVTATVDARGRLVDLKLHRAPSATVDKTILTTVRAAASAAADRVQELMSSTLPPDSGAAEFVRDGDFGSLLRRADSRIPSDD
ncbi:YbaB/EbfC family nucleoid-associated protein [Actinoplanes sp. NPDC051633]|uniref:YbaB/EbfC family nucleoid-associated protein n=1 Tax=Actinoplanes sp. NPDC051633 TaxID=3155670 RepID=UPI0034448ECE